MSKRSGFLKTVLEASTLIENNTWYQTEKFNMSANANCIRVFVDVISVGAERIEFYLEHSPDNINWYKYVSSGDCAELWGPLNFTGPDSKSLELQGVNLMEAEYVRLYYRAASGAGLASIEIKVLTFQSSTPPSEIRVRTMDPFARIAEGLDPRHESEYKFGSSLSLNIAQAPATIWSLPTIYNWSDSADIDTISSSRTEDTQTIVIIGQLFDNTQITQIVALNGQNKVTIPTSLYRAYRMINVSSTDLVGTVYCYVDTPITLGVPVDLTKVRCVIPLDSNLESDNQTQMTPYTIPKGKRGWVTSSSAALAKAGVNTEAEIVIKIRNRGGVFRTVYRTALLSSANSHIKFGPKPPVGPLLEGTDIEVRALKVSSNGTGITSDIQIVLEDSHGAF